MAEEKKKSIISPLKQKKETAAKTAMNLAFHESEFSAGKFLPAAAVLAVGILVFLKFGIIDQISKKTAALNELGKRQSELTLYQAQLKDYDELAEKYGRYSYGWMSEQEAGLVERDKVLTLIENKIAAKSTVENFAISSNVLTVNLRGVTLDEARAIVKELETDPIVKRATIYSATAKNSELRAEIFMTVTLTKEEAKQ